MKVALKTMTTRAALSLAVVTSLAACTPPPDEVVTDVNGDAINSSGLEERLPDTCNLSNYDGYVGQSLAAVAIPTDVDTRIVRPTTILSQIYESARVNFYVGDDGVITRVVCG